MDSYIRIIRFRRKRSLRIAPHNEGKDIINKEKIELLIEIDKDLATNTNFNHDLPNLESLS